MTESEFYERVDLLIAAGGIDRLRDLGFDPNAKEVYRQFQIHERYLMQDGSDLIQSELLLLLDQAPNIPATSVIGALAHKGYERDAQLSAEWTRDVSTMLECRTFLEKHGIGVFLGFPVGDVHLPVERLARFSRERVEEALLKASHLSSIPLADARQRLLDHFEDAVPHERIHLEILHGEPDGYRGGFTTSYLNSNGQDVYVIVLSGMMNDDQLTYALAHELGHVADFWARNNATPAERVLFPSPLQEGIADYHARVAIEEADLVGARAVHNEEIAIRLASPTALLEAIASRDNGGEPAPSLEEVHEALGWIMMEWVASNLFLRFGKDRQEAQREIQRMQHSPRLMSTFFK